LINVKTGYRYPLQMGGPITLGRHPENTIVLDGSAVSTFHAEIRYENNRWVLYNRGSTNGTFVNDRQINGANMLKPGFQVRLGDVTLRVE
jgi:pSer/pThr/pTyr-binding forkhead associated (FHA) protein